MSATPPASQAARLRACVGSRPAMTAPTNGRTTAVRSRTSSGIVAACCYGWLARSSLFRRARGRLANDLSYLLRVRHGAQPPQRLRVPQGSTDLRHDIQQPFPVRRRPQHDEHEVDRLIVLRIEVDGTAQASEKDGGGFRAAKFGVRKRNALPEGRGADLLARLQGVQNALNGESVSLCDFR